GRSKIGARLNTLETARNTQDSLDLANNEIVSELRDLDYAEAVSRLTFQSFVLEAAQSSFVRISSLSLFNFLR
ncbi:flagellin, partial [Pseudophaeobacter arcticus]|uniref:flagellin n=1 Tax=Pseudophaeobacter arcticus TaxID=385492 RepID=UPI00248F5262